MLRALVLSIATLLPNLAQAETYLLMAEEDGCMWCARWHAEIGPIYPKTDEGKVAPLHRYDIHDAPDIPVDFARRVMFTPTFVLVEDGREVGRIEGYPGEDFFWGLLGMMIERADIDIDHTG